MLGGPADALLSRPWPRSELQVPFSQGMKVIRLVREGEGPALVCPEPDSAAADHRVHRPLRPSGIPSVGLLSSVSLSSGFKLHPVELPRGRRVPGLTVRGRRSPGTCPAPPGSAPHRLCAPAGFVGRGERSRDSSTLAMPARPPLGRPSQEATPGRTLHRPHPCCVGPGFRPLWQTPCSWGVRWRKGSRG